MLKKIGLFSLLTLLVFATNSSVHAQQQREVLFQLSTIDGLLSGIYDGRMTLGELKQHGDIGIGTFHALDGEMLVVDGTVYQVTADGAVHIPDPTVTTPFAAVTFFDVDQEKGLPSGVDFQGVVKEIDGLIPTPNLFHAIRIEGTFQRVKTRSVPKQVKPYPPLGEVVKTQPIFDFEDVEGVIVGLRCPPFVKGINVPGSHLHFLTKDKKAGGHVLELIVKEAVLKVDHTPEFSLVLPEDQDFYRLNLEADASLEGETPPRKE